MENSVGKQNSQPNWDTPTYVRKGSQLPFPLRFRFSLPLPSSGDDITSYAKLNFESSCVRTLTFYKISSCRRPVQFLPESGLSFETPKWLLSNYASSAYPRRCWNEFSVTPLCLQHFYDLEWPLSEASLYLANGGEAPLF